MHAKYESFLKQVETLLPDSSHLVLAYEPELPEGLLDPIAQVEAIGGQIEDLFQAYQLLFKEFPIDLDSITADDLVALIQKLHTAGAAHLMQALKRFDDDQLEAGCFSKEVVLRWQDSARLVSLLEFHIMRNTSPMQWSSFAHLPGVPDVPEHKEAFLEYCRSDLSLTDERLQYLRDFYSIFINYGNNAAINPDEYSYTNIYTPDSENPVLLYQRRFIVAYYENLLTDAEKDAVHKVVRLAPRPETIPAKIHTYAEEVLENLRACDPSDVHTLTLCLANIFAGFVRLHPFPNGNGRIGTLLLNGLLRQFRLPMVGLRLPIMGSKDPEYKAAFANIDIDPLDVTLLAALIEKRLSYKHEGPMLMEHNHALYVELLRKIKSLQAESMDPALIFKRNTVIKLGNQLNQKDWHSTKNQKNLAKFLTEMIKEADELHAQEAKKRITTPRFFTHYTFTADERNTAKEALDTYGALEKAWKVNKDGKAWTQGSLSCQKQAEALRDTLIREKVAKNIVLKKTVAEPKEWVIVCEDLNMRLLKGASVAAASSMSSAL